jgi:ribosomal protein L14
MPGDQMTVFPQKYKLRKKVSRAKYDCLVLTVKHKVRRFDGTFCQAYSNGVVMLGRRGEFIGSKVFGPAMREFLQRRGKSYTYKRVLARIGYFI